MILSRKKVRRCATIALCEFIIKCNKTINNLKFAHQQSDAFLLFSFTNFIRGS